MTSRCLQLACFAVLVAACTSHDDNDGSSTPPTVVPKTDPLAASPKLAVVSIASVQMIQDCPDPAPAPAAGATAAAKSAAMPAEPPAADISERPGAVARGGPGFQQPCTQSMMQVAFAGQGKESARVEVKRVRLLTPAGKALDTIVARKPMFWTDETYKPWDQLIQPNTDVKGSYKLSLPNWTTVEAASGKPSLGAMFILELEVEVGGVSQTVRSPEFTREEPHVMVT